MPLDIGLAAMRPGAPSAAEPIVSFDDDENGGYYWFLYPLLHRLADKTGQFIDLYGVAEFRGDDLMALEETLLEARRLVKERPARWSVHVGTQAAPARRELFKEVERSKFLALLDALLGIVERSKATGLPVVCFGG